jgi:hypothetical protein
MIYRCLKPTRLFIALAALCGLLWIFQSDFVLVIPGIKNFSAKPTSRIAKVSVAANSLDSSLIRRALKTHKVQNDLHGYMHYIATDEVVADLAENDPQGRPRGPCSKLAYLLSIIVAESTRLESERAHWVLYV